MRVSYNLSNTCNRSITIHVHANFTCKFMWLRTRSRGVLRCMGFRQAWRRTLRTTSPTRFEFLATYSRLTFPPLAIVLFWFWHTKIWLGGRSLNKSWNIGNNGKLKLQVGAPSDDRLSLCAFQSFYRIRTYIRQVMHIDSAQIIYFVWHFSC